MKYEIIKGSEKDFEGAPEWAAHVVKLNRDSSVAWVSGSDNKYQYKYDPDEQYGHPIQGSFISWDWRDGVEIIAERRPITEPALEIEYVKYNGVDSINQKTTEPVWDGEGLMPSVGMKCLAKQCSQINADEFLVVAIQDGAVFGFWTSTGAATGLDVNRWVFLPIRSPEDAARDEAIESMAEIIEYRTGCSPKPLARWLYEAGYRKLDGK